MHDEWEKYLLSKVELQSLSARKKKEVRQPKGIGMLNGVAPVTVGQNSEASIINKQERDALFAAASRITNLTKTDDDGGETAEKEVKRGGNGRGRGKGKSSNYSRSKSSEGGDMTTEEMTHENSATVRELSQNPEDRSHGRPLLRRHHEAGVSDTADAKPLPPVQFYALETQQQQILDFLKPSVIIVYHPDMTFVREIEVSIKQKIPQLR